LSKAITSYQMHAKHIKIQSWNKYNKAQKLLV